MRPAKVVVRQLTNNNKVAAAAFGIDFTSFLSFWISMIRQARAFDLLLQNDSGLSLPSFGMRKAQLSPRNRKGIGPEGNPAVLLYALWRIRNGRLGGPAIAEQFTLRETDDLSVSYIGWALYISGSH